MVSGNIDLYLIIILPILGGLLLLSIWISICCMFARRNKRLVAAGKEPIHIPSFCDCCGAPTKSRYYGQYPGGGGGGGSSSSNAHTSSGGAAMMH